MLNQTKTTETLHLIRCDIADETYGLDMSWVHSIQRTDRLRRNPEVEGPSMVGQASISAGVHSPVGWLPGTESDVPVFNLARQLRCPSLPPPSTKEESGASQRIVVLNPSPSSPQAGEGKGGRPWGLLVDRVSQVTQVPSNHVFPLPPIVINPSADYFKGVIKLDEELILFLSPERLHPGASLSAGRPEREATSPSYGLISGIKSPTASAGCQRRSYGQIVVFSIAKPHPGERALSFGLSISQVPEILEPLPMVPIPAAPAFVLGLVNWRDWLVPVIDLAGRLGFAAEANLTADEPIRLIIARDKGHVLNSSKGGGNQGTLIGFLVRPAIRVLRLPIAHQPCGRTLPLDQALTRCIVELESETLVIPDIRGILRRDG